MEESAQAAAPATVAGHPEEPGEVRTFESVPLSDCPAGPYGLEWVGRQVGYFHARAMAFCRERGRYVSRAFFWIEGGMLLYEAFYRQGRPS